MIEDFFSQAIGKGGSGRTVDDIVASLNKEIPEKNIGIIALPETLNEQVEDIGMLMDTYGKPGSHAMIKVEVEGQGHIANLIYKTKDQYS